MPLIVNGTTIPENVANVLSVNGTNITNVVCNGTTVWTQSLFSGVWTGSSSRAYSGLVGTGFWTSGNAYQAVYMSGTFIYGAFLYANSTTGLVSGTSQATSSYYIGFYSTPTTLRHYGNVYGASGTGGYVYYSPTAKFSGSSIWGSYSIGLATSGGLLAAAGNGGVGAWIQLN